MEIGPILGTRRGYRRLQKMIDSLKGLDANEVAIKRRQIITFYERYGEQATSEAFGVSRKLIFQWRKHLKSNSGTGMSLEPLSTRPHRLRVPNVDSDIIEFIKSIRNKYSLGKEKIKPLLDEYCRKKGVSEISISSIGNIIKRYDLFGYSHKNKRYHNPNSGWAIRRGKQTKRLRTKHPIKPGHSGHIVSDTVEIVENGIKDYFLSAIDAHTKFAITVNYKRNNSRNMKDFYQRFKSVYPYEIKSWQNDNGGENLGEFASKLKAEGVTHFYSYPRCPKINTFIERYNRTLKEEFIYNHVEDINDKPRFHRELGEYLLFYNTKRVHKSLGNVTPLDYMTQQHQMSHMYVTHTLS
jgi:transposase InsO family protein